MLLRSPSDCAQSRIGLADEGIHRGSKAVAAFGSLEDGAQPLGWVGVCEACMSRQPHTHALTGMNERLPGEENNVDFSQSSALERPHEHALWPEIVLCAGVRGCVCLHDWMFGDGKDTPRSEVVCARAHEQDAANNFRRVGQ